MDYTDEYSEHLTEILGKLKRKDRLQYEIIRKKIDEILDMVPENPDHYKPLKHGMKGFRRVHICKSFVLIFKVDSEKRVIRFEDYDHHDNIYIKYH